MVEGIFHRHQLHLQLVGGDLGLADPEGLLLEGFVLLNDFGIRGGGDADQRLQRLDDLIVLQLGVGQGDLAIFQAPCRFHDNRHLLLDGNAFGIKIINLADFFESDADDFCHMFLL